MKDLSTSSTALGEHANRRWLLSKLATRKKNANGDYPIEWVPHWRSTPPSLFRSSHLAHSRGPLGCFARHFLFIQPHDIFHVSQLWLYIPLCWLSQMTLIPCLQCFILLPFVLKWSISDASKTVWRRAAVCFTPPRSDAIYWELVMKKWDLIPQKWYNENKQ